MKLKKSTVTVLLAIAAIVPGAIIGVSVLWAIGAYVFGLILPWSQVVFGSFPVADDNNAHAMGFIRFMGGLFGSAFSVMAILISRVD